MNSEHGIDIEEIIKMSNDLKCCGNCAYSYDNCEQMKEQNLLYFHLCEHWQFDRLTAEERIKG